MFLVMIIYQNKTQYMFLYSFFFCNTAKQITWNWRVNEEQKNKAISAMKFGLIKKYIFIYEYVKTY